MFQVTFEYRSGIRSPLFRNVRLMGSWDGSGRYSQTWSTLPMEPISAEDGCPAWRASVALDEGQKNWTFQWGVVLDTTNRPNVWGIPTEVGTTQSTSQYREFVLGADGQTERYWFTPMRRLGANKFYRPGHEKPAARFSVWAPHAQKVETVIGPTDSGYIWPDGRGEQRAFAMTKDGFDIWHTDPMEPALADFSQWDHKPYMYKITRDDGSVVYRTDLYSRCQIGSGKKDPANPKKQDPANPQDDQGPWDGSRQDLDGTKSCSVVVDTEQVTRNFSEPNFPENEWVSVADFWAHEFDPLRPIPSRLEDMVIYELHVGALGFHRGGAGTLEDAMAFLDYLADLGVNAVELLPLSEFEGGVGFGYGTSHYYAIEYSGGGRDQFKFFVRECHRRGLAVILDVVYNHYTHDAERAEWMYDSTANEKNLYYWYQGSPFDWPGDNPPGHGGYLDNGSTGYDPNFRSEIVRQMFIGSAAMLVTEFHVDGFRMDLTQAIHRDNVIHASRASCGEANAFGAKFLREWVRTLRLIKPNVVLIAEDHSGWEAMARPQETGGIGFDAVWWSEWYHQLIGDATSDPSKARILHSAGWGGDWPLRMDWLGGTLLGTPHKVVYQESHDEAGNSTYEENGGRVASARTVMVAVNNQLNDGSRPYAQARSRVAAGLTFLAAGNPMFFMGEEVGAAKPFRYNDFVNNLEDFQGLRQTTGAGMFRYFQDLIRLCKATPALRSPNLEIVWVRNDHRLLAFRRWSGSDECLVIGCLANAPFDQGYWMHHGSLAGKVWTEVLSSDAAIYGGRGVANGGDIRAQGDAVCLNLPANGLLVLQRI